MRKLIEWWLAPKVLGGWSPFQAIIFLLVYGVLAAPVFLVMLRHP